MNPQPYIPAFVVEIKAFAPTLKPAGATQYTPDKTISLNGIEID